MPTPPASPRPSADEPATDKPAPYKPALYLIPVPLSPALGAADALAAPAIAIASDLRDFVVEDRKSAWRFLSSFMDRPALDAVNMEVVNEHVRDDEVPALLKPLAEGRSIGLISDAGCPGVADPGGRLVAAAHRTGYTVRPLPGPSSILLGLMASGFSGQRFAFIGYLPREAEPRRKAIRELERRSGEKAETQIFIETPYRSQALAAELGKTLQPHTQVCIALDLTAPHSGTESPGERIIRTSASKLEKIAPSVGKVPAVFLVGPDARDKPS